LLPLAARCGAVLTVEEHRVAGGFGSAVLELLAEHAVVVPTHCLGIGNELVEHGETLASQGLAPGDIAAAALKLIRTPSEAGTTSPTGPGLSD
jgi:1-deoxy-D-xylulose-5-phosphate synthase